MIRKKLLALGCAFALTVGLTACGSSEDNNSNTGQADVTVTDDAGQTTEPTQEADNSANAEEAQTAKVSQLAGPQKGETVATFHIKDYGDIKVHFFPDAAPKAVENFVSLAKAGYYDGVTFHRVINDFMIQGGDPQGNGTGGESVWGQDFEDEINAYLIPLRGALCMANAGGGNTNGSQFFIVQDDSVDSTDTQQLKDQLAYYVDTYKNQTGLTLSAYDDSVIENYKEVGGCLYLSGGYTVFGQVYEGLDVVDTIAATATDGNDKPLENVVIESIDVSTYEG